MYGSVGGTDDFIQPEQTMLASNIYASNGNKACDNDLAAAFTFLAQKVCGVRRLVDRVAQNLSRTRAPHTLST